MANECVFCRIVRGEVPSVKVHEDADTLAFLDIGPLNVGHTLIIPKQHYPRLEDCPVALLGRLAGQLGSLARAVAAAVDAEGYNILVNNGRAAGQLVEHVHFHVIPRFAGDGVLGPWPAQQSTPEQLQAVADQIKRRLA